MIEVKRSRIGKLKKIDLKKIGAKSIETILSRTVKGKDYKGNSFKPYSKSYKEYKRKIRPGSTGVDLILHNEMLQNLRIKFSTKNICKIGFTGLQAIKAGKNNLTRKFFKLSRAEFRKILQLVLK